MGRKRRIKLSPRYLQNELYKKPKAELRKQLLAQRALVPPEDRERMSEKICQRAISLAGFRLAGTILLYAPKEIEVNVYPIAEAAWAQGKAVAFPRCHKSENGLSYMTYHIVEDRSQLKKSTFGIMEPDEDAPLYDPATDEARFNMLCTRNSL